MKTILAATDYSSDAQYAVQYAAKLAACFQAELILFNAFQLSVHASNAIVSSTAVDHMITNNEIRLARIARELGETYHIKVKAVTYMSSIIEEMDHLVSEYQADMVVMGMRNDFLEYKLLGNTTTAILKKAHYPVLVIPFGARFRNIERILFARDRQVIQGDKRLKLVSEIADLFKAEVQVFHVEKALAQIPVETLEDQLDLELEEILNATRHSYKQVKADSVGLGIAHEVEVYQPDMLVMVPHKASLMDSILKRSMTRKMVMNTRVPLLALPDADHTVLVQNNNA